MDNTRADGYAKTEKYYSAYGAWYDHERRTGYYETINRREVAIIESVGRGKDVLEIGCGTGIILNEVAKFAKSAKGIDLSPGMLERAKSKGLDVQVANATSLPFPDHRFDVVYSFKVLAHIPEIKKVFEEAARVVKDDGTIVFEFYNPWSLKRITNILYNLIKKRTVYIRYDSLRRIRSYLPEGWGIVNHHGIKVLALGKKLSVQPAIAALEQRLAHSRLKAFAGYSVVVIKRTHGA